MNGDVDAAIEFLIAEQGTEECSAKSDSPPSQADTSCGNGQSVNFAFVVLRGLDNIICSELFIFPFFNLCFGVVKHICVCLA